MCRIMEGSVSHMVHMESRPGLVWPDNAWPAWQQRCLSEQMWDVVWSAKGFVTKERC